MSRRFLPPRIVLALLAGLLALTAGLKLHLLLTSPFADIVTATPLPILWLALFAEVIVIGVIITRVPSEIKWSVVTGFFAVLAAISLYNVLSGKTSCGCAGAFEIHPAWFFAVNVVALALLMSIRPETRPSNSAVERDSDYCTKGSNPGGDRSDCRRVQFIAIRLGTGLCETKFDGLSPIVRIGEFIWKCCLGGL
jgi:hypothetical protein